MKLKVKNVVIAFIILIILIINIGLGIFFFELRKVDNKNTIKEVVIEPSTPGNTILSMLKKEGLIRNEFMSKVYVKLGKYNLQAGTYDLSTSMSTREIIKTIANGKVTTKYNINLTFIEGKNIRNYAKVISDNTNNTEEDVFNLLKDTEYIDSLINKYWFLTDEIKNKDIYYPLEGYLYPNTYTFKDKDVSVKEIFSAMLNETDKVLTKYKKDIESKIYNRINNGWTLGCDATTYYAFKVDMSEGLLTYEQYNTYNPYNTRHPNVAYPVGPIGNPGESAIEACINPIESDNFYYVADCKTGKSVFTKTEYEHGEAIRRIKASGCVF